MTAPGSQRSEKSWAKRWIGTAVCAAMIAAPAVVVSPAPAQAADSVFYLSGTRNHPAPQQVIDLADIGAAMTFFGTQALQIGYAAALAPFQGATALNDSVAEGLTNLLAALQAAPIGDRLVLIGVSQGDIVLSLLEQALVAAGSTRDVLFVRMAGPSGDTGVMGRNWGFKLPGLSFVTRPADSPFDQVVLNHEYDGLGHWPVDQLNLLAVLNAVLGTLTFHNPNDYAVDLSAFPLSDITTTVNALGATTTTYLIRATGLLPLLRPLQAFGVNDGVLQQWQRVLKPMIDSAYDATKAPTLVRIVQSMVRVVVNELTAMADGIGSVLRRIDAAHRARTATAIEAPTDNEHAAIGPAASGSVTASPTSIALGAAPNGPDLSARTRTEHESTPLDTATAQDPAAASAPEPPATAPAPAESNPGLADQVDPVSAETAATAPDEPHDAAASGSADNDAGTTTDDSADMPSGDEAHAGGGTASQTAEQSQNSTRAGSATAGTRAAAGESAAASDSDAEPGSRVRSPRAAGTPRQARATEGRSSGSASDKDASRTAKDSGDQS